MAMRPVIGITTYLEQARWSVWDMPAAVLPSGYLAKVQAAGGRAVLLPPDDLDADVLDRLDGLVLAGGADLDPRRYGQQAHQRVGALRPDRDASELLLARAAIEADLPVLGICRGMQVLAVAAGGHLNQHLPDTVGHDGHQPGPGQLGQHLITTTPGSRIAELLGAVATVNSYHHQAVADPGQLVITAQADDGVAEAIEDPGHRFLLGVQWHPEQSGDDQLFKALIAASDGGR